MSRPLLIVVAIVAAGIAFMIVRGMSGGTNIEAREKHWKKVIAEGLKPGATKEELEAFARAHGQTLKCYTNAKREDQCDFDDDQSSGGSRNMPMRLAVIFVLRNNKVASHQFATAAVNR